MPSVDLDSPEHAICSHALAIGREREGDLVRECAMLRAQVSRLQIAITELRDPEEVRDDGVRVRKNRWENGIRNIAAALGWRGPQEVADVVAAVRKLIADHGSQAPRKAGDP